MKTDNESNQESSNVDKFQNLGIKGDLLKSILKLGFKEPSEIQVKAIPVVLEGKDVIGNAATGSGKTLAFASALIQNLEKKKGIQALVLTPTRELAEQISGVIKTFAGESGLLIEEVYGGKSFDRQVEAIRGANIIVGTPGRVLDHLSQRTLNLSNLKILVLDEADRMVDMGFLPDVEKITLLCPKDRQTLLFSATVTKDIEYMEKNYMKSPVRVSVEKYVDPSKLKQVYYDLPTNGKFSLLVHLLKKEDHGTIMIFCNTRRMVDALHYNLKSFKIDSEAIHGGLTQNKRGRIIESVHNKEVQILICTDVAARGLDIKGVTHVYNYDCPKTSEDYIHRIGRTARAGSDGMAITLISNRDYESFQRVIEDNSLNLSKQEIPETENLYFKMGFSGRGNRERRGFGGRRNFRDRRDFGRGENSHRRTERGFGRSDDRRRSGRFGNSSGRRDRGFGRRW